MSGHSSPVNRHASDATLSAQQNDRQTSRVLDMESSPQTAVPSRAVCVLGMHRSGTSVVSRMLGLLGAYLGPEGSALPPNPDNPKGFWEHRSFVALNDDILSRFNGAWDNPPNVPDGWATSPALGDIRQRARDFIRRDFGNSPLWAWKDPRTCLTIPFWQQLLPAMDYVLCLRDPVDVAHSLRRRDGFSIEKGVRLWLAYTAAALRSTSNRRRSVVFYEDIMQDSERELERLAAFLDQPLTAAIRQDVREFLAPDLYHHRSAITASVDEPGVDFPSKSLYLALRALHGRAQPDAVRSELDAAIDLYSAHALEHQAGEADRRKQVQALRVEADLAREASAALRVERDLAREESAALREQLGQAERHIGVVTSERDASKEQLRAERSEWAEQEAELLAQKKIAEKVAASETEAQWTARFRDIFRAARAQLATRHASGAGPAGRIVGSLAVTAKSLDLLHMPRTWPAWRALIALFGRPGRLRDAHIIASSGLFDPIYYADRYPDVRSSRSSPLVHFVLTGAAESRQPHPLFDPAWYQSRMPNGALQGQNPLVHYVLWGGREGVDPHPLFSSAHYGHGLNGTPMIAGNPLIDYLKVGVRELRAPHPLFDPIYYLETNPDVRSAGIEPLTHFLTFGATENRRPNPLFDCRFYESQAPEAAESGINPLVHFVTSGWRDSLSPSADFDAPAYLAEHGDVRNAGLNPLEHYLSYGRVEGRRVVAVGSRATAAGSSSSSAASTRKPSWRRGGGQLALPETCRRFALYTSSLGNYFFHEIRDLLAAGLRELGFSVATRDERQGFAPDADWHVVVAPHEFFYLGAGSELRRQRIPGRLVLLNTEQPSTQWFSLARDCFEAAYAIWDISFESARTISATGRRCWYLPLGYSTEFEGAREVPILPDNYGTRFLPREIVSTSFHGRALAERPIDVFFVGHASARRERFFAVSAPVLSRHRCYLHFSNVAAPVVPGRTTHMDTPTVMGLAQRSRILLNIHHGSDRYFEWHRIVIEGIWQRTLVVSEPCGIAPPFKAGVDFVEAPLDAIPAAIDYYLSTAEGRREAERIVDHGFRTLTESCRLTHSLRTLILALHDVPEFPDGFIAERLAPPADGSQDNSAFDRAAGVALAPGAGHLSNV